MYWKRNHQTDDEMEQVLNEKYANKIQGNRDKKQDMVKFFAAMKDPSLNLEQEQKMKEVLYGGKGDKKRHYAVDEKLYGTEEGVGKRLEAEEEVVKNGKVKKKRKKKKKKKKKAAKDEVKTDALPLEKDAGAFSVETKSIAAVGAIGVLALATLLVNGKRS
jgi:hypothetical protein